MLPPKTPSKIIQEEKDRKIKEILKLQEAERERKRLAKIQFKYPKGDPKNKEGLDRFGDF